MKIKTSELTGAALDLAVANCEGWSIEKDPQCSDEGHGLLYCYSANWSQGGPIIEREGLHVGRRHQCDPAYCTLIDPDVICCASTSIGGFLSYGPTYLIAAMRCYVASKLGDEVDIPKELLK